MGRRRRGGSLMSRWTELQATVRHRFGIDVEGGPETPGEERAVPSSALPERCYWDACMYPAEGMLCRTHRVEVGAFLRELDPMSYVWDWIAWTVELGWA